MNRIGNRLILPWLLTAASLAACSSPPVVDPPATPVESDRSGAMENTVIVILGASYAAGWQPAGTDGLRYVNKGEGGQQSFEMLERYDRDVLPEKPQAVILWGYINDIFRSDRDGVAAAKDRAKDSFREMIRKSVENGVEPILATEVTIRPKKGFKEALGGLIGGILGKEGYQEYVNKQVAELNRWLRDEAGRNGLLLLDFETVLAGADGFRRKEFARDDGSHIPPAGYAALDAYAGPILKEKYSGSGDAGI